MTRGLVLPLTLDQIADRAVRLGSPDFVSIYYRMDMHQGGTDPTAPDPADRWQHQGDDGKMHEAITAECIAGAVWCGGFDRVQRVRMAHVYEGDINCNSMVIEATKFGRCFKVLPKPVRGCFLVAPTGAPGFESCGHIITLHTVPEPDAFDIDDIKCWEATLGTDIASRGPHRANTTHDATWWFRARHHGAIFVVSTMQP